MLAVLPRHAKYGRNCIARKRRGAEVLPTVDARLNLDECLRQLHVVAPEGQTHVGWDAVACLARLFPSTWLIGALGQR